MRRLYYSVALALLALVGFVAGRWVVREKATPVKSQTPEASASLEVAAVEALFVPPAVGPASIGWMKRIFAGDLKALEAELMAMDENERTTVCLAVIARMDAATMRALVDTHFGAGSSEEDFESWFEATGGLALFAFADRWAELDAAGMVTYALERLAAEPQGSDLEDLDDISPAQMIAFGTILTIAKFDPERALELAGSMSGELGGYAMMMAAGALAGSDPQRAIELMRENGGDPADAFTTLSPAQAALALPVALALEDEDERNEAVESIINRWAERDPAAAFAAARESGNIDGLEEAVRIWATSDPQAVREKLELLDPEVREAMGKVFATSWAETEPLAAVQWAEAQLDPETFRSFLASQLNELPAQEALRLLEPPASTRISRDPFNRLVEEDPMAAIAWLAQQPAELIEELERSKDRTGESLAMLGADAVRQGLEKIPPGEFRTGTIRSALEFIGYSDPVAAQALMQGLSDAERAAAMEGLAMGWVEREPRTALEFVHAQRDEIATESALVRWSIMDPAAAHGWTLEKVGSDPVAVAERVETIGLADTWARRDPLAAGEAMLALPELAAAPQVATVVGIWARSEPIAASAFINTHLEPGSLRDEAVFALIEQIRTRDPKSAAEWAASIGDPDLRAKARELK